MFCIKCDDDRNLKFLPSQSNSKRETWGCPAQGCDYKEVYLLEQPRKKKEDWAA